MKIVIPSALLLAGSIAFVQELVSQVEASRRYVAMLPNGANVTGYRAIGHPDGTGRSAAVNNFGRDFARVGYAWTKEFCMNDTDGDGQTNDQELGDPCCQWNRTANPVVLWTIGVSHPDNASLVSDPKLWANVVCNNTSTAAPTTAPNVTVLPSTTSPPVTTAPPSTTAPPVTTSPPSTTSPPVTTAPPSTTRPPMTTCPPSTTRVPTTSSPPSTTRPPVTTHPATGHLNMPYSIYFAVSSPAE